MSDNAVLTIALPIALGIIMIGLGLHLTIADFRRVFTQPRAVSVALFVQVVALPPVALLLARAFGLPGELGLGLVLLATSPGGVTANLFSHLARGDIALNITLTAINSLVVLVTIPIWVALAMNVVLDTEATVPAPVRKVIEVAVIVIGPVAIGMLIRAWKPAVAAAMEKPLRILSTLILAALIVLAIGLDWQTVVTYAPVVGLACLIFNVLSLGSGFLVSRAMRIARPQAIAISFEIGIHNSTLAIFIALQVLQRPDASIAPAIYALIMYVTAGLFAAWLIRSARRNGDTASVIEHGRPTNH